MKPLALAILSLIGFGIALYIYRRKAAQSKVICLVGHKCDEVLSSKYGRLLGFRNEILGMGYYALYFAIGVIGLSNFSVIEPFRAIILAASLAALAFSAYLVWTMGFVLRKWCDYCVAASVVNVLIVIAGFV